MFAKERIKKGRNRRIPGSVEEARGELQFVPVHLLRRSVSGKTRNDLEILFHGNS